MRGAAKAGHFRDIGALLLVWETIVPVPMPGPPAAVAAVTSVGFAQVGATVATAHAKRPARPSAAPVNVPAASAPKVVSWSPSNHVTLAAVGLDAGVAAYRSCNQVASLPRSWATFRDWCADPSVVWLMGHNPGILTSTTSAPLGALVSYWDFAGRRSDWRVSSRRVVSLNQADVESHVPGPPKLVFQTCANATGSLVWLVTALPA